MAMVVQHVVLPVFGDVALEYMETVAMNRADKHGAKPIEKRATLSLSHTVHDAFLELRCRALGEGESNDRRWFDVVVTNQARHTPRDRFGLSGPGARDHAQITAAVRDHSLLRAG